jgi:ribosomal protein S18 acetylase RimI-like enzyme
MAFVRLDEPLGNGCVDRLRYGRPVGTSIVIRAATGSDIETLEATYPEPGRPESRHSARIALQDRGEGVYLIAWMGRHPVGWVFVHPSGSAEASERASRSDAAEIVDLWVAEELRGQGHGSALLQSAEEVARDAGWATLGLAVTVSNPYNDVARAMYERRGYRDAGFGEFEDGYFYWTDSGEQRWDGEPHRYLIRSARRPK